MNNVKKTDIENASLTPEIVDTLHDHLNDQGLDASNILAQQQDAFVNEYTKLIPVPALTSVASSNIKEAIVALFALHNDIMAKRDSAAEKKAFIKEKIEVLRVSGKVNIDQDEFLRFDTSIQEFISLLETMIGEVTRDIAFYQKFLSDAPQETMRVLKNESDDFEDHIENRLKSIKKYVKTAKRDLSISYSRYCHGFDVQSRYILYIERMLQQAAHQASKKVSAQ